MPRTLGWEGLILLLAFLVAITLGGWASIELLKVVLP